jgi:hypothetical protein
MATMEARSNAERRRGKDGEEGESTKKRASMERGHAPPPSLQKVVVIFFFFFVFFFFFFVFVFVFFSEYVCSTVSEGKKYVYRISCRTYTVGVLC